MSGDNQSILQPVGSGCKVLQMFADPAEHRMSLNHSWGRHWLQQLCTTYMTALM
jgi:hypothetical protein